MSDFVSIREASKETGYSTDHIRKLMRDGDVKGRKVVTVWQVDLEDLKRHKQEQERRREGSR